MLIASPAIEYTVWIICVPKAVVKCFESYDMTPYILFHALGHCVKTQRDIVIFDAIMCAHFLVKMGLGFKLKIDTSSHKLGIDSLNKFLESIKKFNDINSYHVFFNISFRIKFRQIVRWN